MVALHTLSRRDGPRRAGHLAPLLLLLAASACGHPATEQECERILERTARLEIQERLGGADEKVIQAEIKATKASLRESMKAQCVGKRITASALDCVERAESSRELTEECFR